MVTREPSQTRSDIEVTRKLTSKVSAERLTQLDRVISPSSGTRPVALKLFSNHTTTALRFNPAYYERCRSL
jgi:hypothetical protein